MRKYEIKKAFLLLRRDEGSKEKDRGSMNWIDSIEKVMALSLEELSGVINDRAFWRSLNS